LFRKHSASDDEQYELFIADHSPIDDFVAVIKIGLEQRSKAAFWSIP